MKFSIRNRLYALAAAAVLVSLLVALIGWRGMHAMNGYVHRIAINAQALRNQKDADMYHEGLRANVFRAFFARTPAELQEVQESTREDAQKFRDDLTENEGLPLSTELHAAITAAGPETDRYIDLALSLVEQVGTDRAAAMARRDEFEELFHTLERVMEDVSQQMLVANEQVLTEARSAQARSEYAMFAAALLAMILLVVITVLLVSSITKPIQQFSRALETLAEGAGDLTARMDAHERHEIGHMAGAFNRFVEKLHAVIVDIRRAMDAVRQASREMHAASDSISASAQMQASSLEETAASLEQITATIRQNADNANLAKNLATTARDVAERGGGVVGEAVAAMAEINESSRRIGVIISTIDEIAFQTNLLALNAAVEAARAGEQGRGFAVVASEVRNLAQRSADAAREIKGLVSDSLQKVESGSNLVNRSGGALEEIVVAVKRVTDVVAEIATASQEQAIGVEEVNRAVMKMDEVTQSNAAQTEELSATAGHLSDRAREVHDLIGRFRVLEA